MMGKQRGHRARKRMEHANDPAPAIRLVERAGTGVPAEPLSAGRSGAPEPEILIDGGIAGLDPPEAGGRDVDPGVDKEPTIIAAYVNDDNRLVLVSDAGFRTEFALSEPNIYEMFEQHHDGAVIEAVLRWMFTCTDCVAVRRIATESDSGVLLPWGVREFVLPLDGIDTDFLSVGYDAWVRNAPHIANSGRLFRERLASEFERHDRPPPWTANEWTDRHLGAFAEMLNGGQVDKAIILYNRFARWARLPQFVLASHQPLLINISGAVLLIENGTFQVIRCLQ